MTSLDLGVGMRLRPVCYKNGVRPLHGIFLLLKLFVLILGTSLYAKNKRKTASDDFKNTRRNGGLHPVMTEGAIL